MDARRHAALKANVDAAVIVGRCGTYKSVLYRFKERAAAERLRRVMELDGDGSSCDCIVGSIKIGRGLAYLQHKYV
jgi:hypothetical protein